MPHRRSISLRSAAIYLLLGALVCAGSLSKRGTSAVAQQQNRQRLVFAHYMLTNQDYQGDSDPTQEQKIASYEREIREARGAGIDGFALNAGGWLREPYYIRYASQMFEAAARLHTGFLLMFSADMCCGNTAADIEDMMRRFAGNPRYSAVYFHYGGGAVLTTFAGDKLGPAAWEGIRGDLERGEHPSTQPEPSAFGSAAAPPSNAPLQIFLVPAFFWGGEVPKAADIQAGLDEWKSVIDGSFYWGIAGVPGSGGDLDQIPSSEAYAAAIHAAHKLYMAPVCLQFWGANADRYYEYSGAAGMRVMWMDAIERSHPEWVEIITWNDFIEGTYVSPIDNPNKYASANYLDSTGVPRDTLGFYHSHSGATALLPYFIQWYKTGVEPKITRDAIYFFYRTQPRSFDAGKPPVARKFGPVADAIYITAMLTGPAELRVSSGRHSVVLHLAAGNSDVEAPFYAGDAPLFELSRAGKIVATGRGTDPILAQPKYNDFYYSTGSFTAR